MAPLHSADAYRYRVKGFHCLYSKVAILIRIRSVDDGSIAFRRCLYRVFSVSCLVAKSMESWNRLLSSLQCLVFPVQSQNQQSLGIAFLSFFSVQCFLFSCKINGVMESFIIFSLLFIFQSRHSDKNYSLKKSR